MKICFVTTSYPLYPEHFQGNFVRIVAIELVNRGHEVRVIAPGCYKYPNSEIDQGVSIKRFQYFPIKRLQKLAYGSGILPNVKRSAIAKFQIPLFLMCFAFRAFFCSRGYDIIHAHWSVSALPGILIRNFDGTPVILSLRGSDFSGAGGKFVETFTQYLLKLVDGIITENDGFRKKALILGYPAEQVVTIRNGVNLSRFNTDGRKKRSILRRYNAESAGTIIIFAGRLSYVKGPDIAIDAFERIVNKCSKCHLIIIGDGEMRNSLEAKCFQSGLLRKKVVFVGEVSNISMPSYYKAADIGIISSRSEGTPNFLIECLASGIPVVSFPVGGIPEVIQNDITGIVVKDNSVESLATGLMKLIKNEKLRKRMGTAARCWAEENLSWSRTIDDYLSFYRKILEKQKREPFGS